MGGKLEGALGKVGMMEGERERGGERRGHLEKVKEEE